MDSYFHILTMADWLQRRWQQLLPSLDVQPFALGLCHSFYQLPRIWAGPWLALTYEMRWVGYCRISEPSQGGFLKLPLLFSWNPETSILKSPWTEISWGALIYMDSWATELLSVRWGQACFLLSQSYLENTDLLSGSDTKDQGLMALCSPGPRIAGSRTVTQSVPGWQREVLEPHLHTSSLQTILRAARHRGGSAFMPTHSFQSTYYCFLHSCSLSKLACVFILTRTPLYKKCAWADRTERRKEGTWGLA